MTSTLRIICVCSGNICRSPMAAALLKEKLKDLDRPAVIISAGTLGLSGHPAAIHAQAAVRAVGCDLGGHRSQGASIGLLRMADHIVIMSTRHEDAILAQDPSLEARLVRLWLYDSETRHETGIPDPVGQDLAAFVGCRDLIDRCLNRWLDELHGTDIGQDNASSAQTIKED
ncbi:MAG: low molecular weight phosphatase family protein [Bradymonadaceae bacterium]